MAKVTSKQVAALKKIESEDYQNRKWKSYPDSGIPDSISVYADPAARDVKTRFWFKCTSEDEAEDESRKIYNRTCGKDMFKGTGTVSDVNQIGDYQDDWVEVTIISVKWGF